MKKIDGTPMTLRLGFQFEEGRLAAFTKRDTLYKTLEHFDTYKCPLEIRGEVEFEDDEFYFCFHVDGGELVMFEGDKYITGGDGVDEAYETEIRPVIKKWVEDNKELLVEKHKEYLKRYKEFICETTNRMQEEIHELEQRMIYLEEREQEISGVKNVCKHCDGTGLDPWERATKGRKCGLCKGNA